MSDMLRYAGDPRPAALAYEAARRAAVDAALDYLGDAQGRCAEADVQCDCLAEALHFLRRHVHDPRPFEAFDAALAMPNPRSRWQNANAALNAIRRLLGG